MLARSRPAPCRKRAFSNVLKHGLTRTRSSLTEGLARPGLGKKTIDDELLEEIETHLLMADVGAEATATHHRRISPRR